MNQLKAILKNWRTSALGILFFLSLLMWYLDKIDTNQLIAVMGFISGLGFFITKDNTVTGVPKK